MAKYFIYFFAMILSVSELAGFACMSSVVALCIVLWQDNPNFTQETLMINNLHIFLSTLGSVFLTANGIILFRLLRNYKTTFIKHVHAFVLGVALIVTIWGVWSGYKAVNYSAPDRIHFNNIHSVLGAVSLGILLIQYAIGVAIYLTDAFSLRVAQAFTGFHGFIGISSLIFNSVTGIVGLSMKANEPLNFDRVQKDADYVEANYDKFTTEYRIIFAAALFMALFAWNFFYITVNPYFEWTMIEKY